MSNDPHSSDIAGGEQWYAAVTRYQWLVLLIASLGWVFDIFEGQIFVASMNEAMPSLVSQGTSPDTIQLYNQVALAAFLLGGALGGIVFGMLSDRIGRKKTMSYTILMYSLFTCVSALSQTWWHLVVFRFLVAMGVGGEWAVASAMVAEVFPKQARARSLGIFHASSVFGTYLAVAAGFFIIGNDYLVELGRQWDMPSLPWRIGFALGAVPALLIIWIRRSLHEPESWHAAQARASTDITQRIGRLGDLFQGRLLGRTLVGVTLAAVGLATFWGAHIYGKNVLRDDYENSLSVSSAGVEETTPDAPKLESTAVQAKIKRWEMIGMFLVTTGGGLGLVSFGPLCERIGRRGAFLFFHLGGLASALFVFHFLPQFQLGPAERVKVDLLVLPIFGYLTLGMHAGYAIYFPELYPTRLRGSGTGFCFNAGRILAAPVLLGAGYVQKDLGYSLAGAASAVSFLYLLGAAVLIFAPETKGEELPE